MAAVASSSRLSLDAAPSGTQDSTQPSPPRLLLRLPQQPETHQRRHPLKRKWRSIVNFFALPIRSYYLEPPGLAYRNQQRARRAHAWDGHDDHTTYCPCPAYTDQVGDDEMVLFKAQEEAEAYAAMQRNQQAAAIAAQEQEPEQMSSPELNDALTDDDEDQDQENNADQAVEQFRSWPQTPPEAFTMSVIAPAEPSPRYESIDPLSTFPLASLSPPQPIPTPQRPRFGIRNRTTSNLAPSSTDQPSLINGIAMSRQRSTPLSATVLSSSPPTSVWQRRSRAQTSFSAARPTLAGRNISEPLSWTLVRSQYSYPKRGLTAEQLTFLSLVESLGRFGVPHSPEVAPSPAYEVSGNGGVDYGFPLVEGDGSQR
ncbi:uncharacterized protein SPSC_06159 [Sporisorium scitamineum]|uniref:Uncharacterized protein n=1 Tax=Sporisorium scitamineum TaxID=49012 RepID=A0A0F7RRP3_9BASI|nr:hypothetical protein [Sporisorium scitamineum]CDU25988.1 uncharacterized protein SPSC_06159 [Sporisorium scitamineum]